MTATSSKMSAAMQFASASPALKGLVHPDGTGAKPMSLHAKSNNQQELKDKFTQFVGEAFYGQMLKAMRSSVGKPAYFYGGHAEEVFQGQLDQTMSEQLTKTSASKFAEPLFEHQFPNLAASKPAASLNDLTQLRRK
jgi:peptidoglycan hydrolase FlgJ